MLVNRLFKRSDFTPVTARQTPNLLTAVLFTGFYSTPQNIRKRLNIMAAPTGFEPVHQP